MPSMRPQPTAPVASPAPKPPAGARRAVKSEPPREEPPPTEEELAQRAGGFHESSYELKTGMDMMETEWPEDTTIPGALDES